MTDDIGGIWRTVGGRRIFIKDGQNLVSAMKESGKFKVLNYNGRLSLNSSEKDNNTKVMELGYIDKAKKEEALKYYENKISKEKVENAIIIQNDGKIIRCVGEDDNVGIYGNLKNAIVTHNHPTINGEIGGSLGKDDLQFLINNKDNDICLRVVDDIYNYELKIKKDFSLNDYQEAYRNCKLIDDDYKHCVMIELKERGFVDYERNIRK